MPICINEWIIYLVGDHFGVEFETFGNVELAERGAQLSHHFQLGPHVAAAVDLQQVKSENRLFLAERLDLDFCLSGFFTFVRRAAERTDVQYSTISKTRHGDLTDSRGLI